MSHLPKSRNAIKSLSISPIFIPDPMELSVVIPVYNEEENIEPLMREIHGVLGPLGKSYEIVAVDDGSKDGTFTALRKIRCMLPMVRAVRLKRNFGQTAALAPGLIGMLEEGNDLVAGWRSNRKDPFFRRRLPSMLANCLISWTTSVKLHDYGCTLKAMRKEVAKNLRLYGEMHRFIPAIAYERGAQIAEIKVNHRPRLAGQSKYGMSRTLRVILD